MSVRFRNWPTALMDAATDNPAAWQQRRVAWFVLLVPAIVLLSGAVTADLRVALLAGLVVIGWTQLVGL